MADFSDSDVPDIEFAVSGSGKGVSYQICAEHSNLDGGRPQIDPGGQCLFCLIEEQRETIRRIQAKSARRRRALRGLHKSYMLMDRWCQVARVRALALNDGEGAALSYELQGRVDALEGHVSSARKKVKELQAKLDRVAPCACPECGPNVAVDEDACCVTYGADAAVGGFRVNTAPDLTDDQILAWKEGDDPPEDP